MIQRNIVTSILLYERIRTTKKRAQVVKPLVDYIITIAKNDNTAVAIRRINQFVTDKNACRKAIEVLKDRYADRSSGYTRMIPVGMRKGDGAMLVDLELLEGKAVAPKAPKASAKAEKKVTAKASKKKTIKA